MMKNVKVFLQNLESDERQTILCLYTLTQREEIEKELACNKITKLFFLKGLKVMLLLLLFNLHLFNLLRKFLRLFITLNLKMSFFFVPAVFFPNILTRNIINK